MSYSKFHCVNASDKYVIAVDDKYIECESKDQAIALYDQIGCIENSPFGSCALLAPREVCKKADWAGGEIATESIQANAKKVNADYIKKRAERADYKFWENNYAKPMPAHQRLSIKKQFDSIFGF